MNLGVGDNGGLALIGFGEAAQAFLLGWRQKQPDLTARVFDIKTLSDAAGVRDAKLAEYDAQNVTGCKSAQEAVEGARIVVSLVTADQAHTAASSTAPYLSQGALFFDGNSCAPGTKGRSAGLVGDGAGLYVDMAVMAPVHPKLHKTPILLCGPNADAGLAALDGLDMAAKIVEGDVGRASSIKMVRSIMVKGMEALVLECVLAGRRAGVGETVMDSLEVSYPGFGFKKRAAYMMERALTHGPRRAAEMEEVAITVQDLGFAGAMSSSTAQWEKLAGDLGLKGEFSGDEDYTIIADAILAKLDADKD